MLCVLKPGMQSTLQGNPRTGQRHLGVPYSGPADPVSMALANRLVGNTPTETALEITLGDFTVETMKPCSVALTGTQGDLTVNGSLQAFHRTLHLKPGDILDLRPPPMGMRSYLAIRSGFVASAFLESASTYLPAGFGGFEGRALKAGDKLQAVNDTVTTEELTTPEMLRFPIGDGFALRACPSAETHLLSEGAQVRLFGNLFKIGIQATRMGLTLEGQAIIPASDGMMKSAPVFPGTVQGPPSGQPIMLLSDAQTTGGYPRIAHIIRADRHLLGQLRPGDFVRLDKTSPDEALELYRKQAARFGNWVNTSEL